MFLGAFLIPYFCALLLCGMPLFYLEVAIGQFSSLSPTGVWKVCPLFKGEPTSEKFNKREREGAEKGKVD